ncbi:unnamed protein product [Rotaria sordida]|uniref:Uncharacterized protein n=1 Tax=Rotaria sordida TaxID=392033 RepID=A0A815PVR8_9BILA|nr:unnamed protein product [Rotaria sordida]
MITRRQTGLIHSLCNALLFYLSTSDHSSNENKHQRPKSANLENNLLIHLIPIVIFSIRELINRISYSNFNIEIIDSQNQIFSFTNITDLLQSSQPLFYLQEYQRFKLFLIILNRLISSSSTTTQQTNYR